MNISENLKLSRGLRGAITLNENTKDQIKEATLKLLNDLINLNNLDKDDISSVIFTLTPDLNADFPAKYARIHLGWDDVPMICAQEIPVENSLKQCIRVLITFNTSLKKHELKHVYLGEAKKLRPDLS